MTVRVGAIDCGTNSIRLLVADLDVATGALVDVTRETRIVRLGHGVDATGVIAPEAMARTLAAATDYARACRDAGCTAVRFVATSASRDARNAGEFVAGVQAAFAAFGTTPEVISGEEEAALSFRGATAALRASGRPSPYLVVDIGGGSTELVRGGGGVEQSRSVDIGCVRLTERHLAGDPPTAAEVARAEADVTAALDDAARTVDLSGIGTLVGLAGSVTTVTARALRLPAYDPVAIDGAAIAVADVERSCSDLLAMPRGARVAEPYMHPGRVDVIGAGALVWRAVVRRVAQASGVTHATTSEHDILDGIAWSAAERGA